MSHDSSIQLLFGFNFTFERNAGLQHSINSLFYNLSWCETAQKVDFGNEKVPFHCFITKILLL